MLDSNRLLDYLVGMTTDMHIQINPAMFALLVEKEMELGYTHEEAVERVHDSLDRNNVSLKTSTVLA